LQRFPKPKTGKKGGTEKNYKKNQKKNKNYIMTMCGQQILLNPVGFSDETATWLDSEKKGEIYRQVVLRVT